MFGMSYQYLMPIFALRVLDVGATGTASSARWAARGADRDAAAVKMAAIRYRGQLMLGSAAVFGVLVAAFALSTSLRAVAGRGLLRRVHGLDLPQPRDDHPAGPRAGRAPRPRDGRLVDDLVPHARRRVLRRCGGRGDRYAGDGRARWPLRDRVRGGPLRVSPELARHPDAARRAIGLASGGTGVARRR
jgi:hypothetical protein